MRIDFKPFIWLVASLLLASLACGAFGASPTVTSLPPTVPAAPADSPIPPTLAVPPNSGECTTLQDLNIRTGPGLAYRNPIGVVLAGTIVEPLGFVPVGIPGGPWIMIEVEGANQNGWITAGQAFLTCNVDLDSLPEVDFVPPPPPPLPQTAQTSDPEGGCGPNEDYQCDVIITDDSFLQFKIFQNGQELTENDNIVQVSFSVRQGVYSNVEETSTYCIFGGNGPCNPWPEEDFVAYWRPGISVTPGTYFIEILATVDENGDEKDVRWAADFDISLP